MKKAGLCVRYDCDNFGSMLQIFATQRAIEKVGWNYEIIRYNKFTFSFILKNVTRVFNPYFMRGKLKEFQRRIKLKFYPEVEKGCKTRSNCIKEYRETFIGPYSCEFNGFEKLREGSSDYDAIIVGSDQLWTPAGIKSKFYNLLFVPDNIKKVSFATSFGVGAIPKSQQKMTSQYLKRIDFISVREIKGAEIIKSLIDKDVTVALDPTLLFSGSEWEQIFPTQRIIEEPYILAYFLGSNEEHRDVIDSLGKSCGLKIVTIPFMDEFLDLDLGFGDTQLYDVGPIDFLNLIRGAEYICTDSFHGTVFSILNHKKFITFNRTRNNDKQTRNSRIDSLFDLLSLENRRYSPQMDVWIALEEKIDYSAVEQRLQKLRMETMEFLDNALNS